MKIEEANKNHDAGFDAVAQVLRTYLIYEDDGDAGNVADAHIAGRYKKNIVKAQEEANVYAARAACKAAAANQHQPGPQSTSLFIF